MQSRILDSGLSERHRCEFQTKIACRSLPNVGCAGTHPNAEECTLDMI